MSMVALLGATATVALAQPPSNDDIVNATIIPEIPFTDTADTTEATSDVSGCAEDAATVWYSFMPTSDIAISVDTFGSDYDTTLTAFVGTPDSLELITCNDDTHSLQSQIVFHASAGVTYWIMAGSCCSGPGGQLVVNVDEGPPPPSVSVSVDPVGSFDPQTGTATISGAVTCTDAHFVELYVSLRQRAGRDLIRGDGYDYLPCEGVTPWVMEMQGDGIFAGGRAQVSYDAYACTFDCAFDFGQTSVRLTGKRR